MGHPPINPLANDVSIASKPGKVFRIPPFAKHAKDGAPSVRSFRGWAARLWISRGIVARHHGSLTLRSSEKPGWNGTAFSLFLPDEQNPSKPTQ